MSYPVPAASLDGTLALALAALLPSLSAWTVLDIDYSAIHVGAWPDPDHLPNPLCALIRPPLLMCLLQARDTRRWSGSLGIELHLPVPSDSTHGEEAMACLAAVANLRDSLAQQTLGTSHRIDSVELKSFERGEWTALNSTQSEEEPTTVRVAGYRSELVIAIQSLGM